MVRLVLYFLVAAAFCLASCGGSSGAAVDTASDSGSDSDTLIQPPCSESDQFVAADMGALITYELLDMPSDVVIADQTSYRTDEGEVRLYFWAGKMGLENTGAYSVVTVDGITVSLEEGLRVPSPYGHPKLFRLDTGEIRIFHLIPEGLGSHISEDGLHFTSEEGMRISSDDAGLERIGGMSVVALPAGGYRGYFSNLGIPGVSPADTVDQIKSATSPDQLNWQIDGGVRIGQDAPHLTGRGRQPFALDRGEGCITLFYQHIDTQPTKLYYATASDGLVFGQEYALGIEGWDGPEAGANIQQLGDDSYRLFYDAQSAELGNHIRVATFQLVP